MRNYTYIVQCADGSLYTGWTNHLRERIEKHNSEEGAKYTRARRPVRLVYAECHEDKTAAMRREAAIKQLTRAGKEKLLASADIKAETYEGGCPVWEEFKVGKIFYLMGKSASGKDMIYKRLIIDEELSLKPIVLYTTRPLRTGETDGKQYHFTDEAHLKQMQEEGRVIELRSYDTACGVWHYFTADDDTIDLTKGNYLAIGTLSSYKKLRAYFGKEALVPLLIEVSDGIRLERALKREKKQEEPKYEEMCRRFLADQKDFSDDKIRRAGITLRFRNEDDKETCVRQVKEYIMTEGN